MPELSGLPAMNINPAYYGARANTAVAESGLAQLNLQKQQTLQPLEIQQQSELIPLATANAKRQSQLQDLQASNEMLSQTARDAQAADPEDAPGIWDKGMQAAADAGHGVAKQYIGHYRPDLAERVGDIYGGQSQPRGQSSVNQKAQALDDQAIDRAVSQMPAPQLIQALKRADTLITSFNNVKDRDSWNAELQILKDAGVDLSKALPNTDWNPINYALAARRVKDLVPYRDAMAARAGILGIGAKPPAPTPLGTSTYIGSQPSTQKPVYHNPVTNEDTIGPNAVGPKPSAAISNFQFKYTSALNSGMSENDALQFANGRKSLPPERLKAIAISEANRQLGDASLAGEQIPNPDTWVKEKAAANYAELVQAAGGATPGGKSPPPANIPQRAIDAVKAKGGQPVRFQNGQVYRWDAKTNRAVQVR